MKIDRIFVSASVVVLIVGIVISIFTYRYIKAKGSDDCLVCHEDKSLTMDVNGKKISI